MSLRSGALCLRATPWISICCVLLLVAGVPLWYISSLAAAEGTRHALASAAIDATAVLTAAEAVFNNVRVAGLVLLVACTVLVVLAAAWSTANTVKKYTNGAAGACSLRSYLVAGAASTTVVWLTMLAVVVLLTLSATWFLGSWAGSTLLSSATQYSMSAEKAAAKAVSSANQLVSQVQQMQLLALETAPPEVRDTQWFKQFQDGVKQINSESLFGPFISPRFINRTCPPGCASLDFLAGLAGLNDNCLCITATITDLQSGLQSVQQSLLPALIGLILLYLAASWLLIQSTSSFVNASRDLQQVKTGSYFVGPDGNLVLRTGGSRNSSSSTSSTLAVDAAVDIQGSATPHAAGTKAWDLSRGDAVNPVTVGRYRPTASHADNTAHWDQGSELDASSNLLLTRAAVDNNFSNGSHTSLFGADRPVWSEAELARRRSSEPQGSLLQGDQGSPRRHPHRVVYVGDRTHEQFAV